MAPTFLQVTSGLFAVFAALSAVRAETHTIKFDNQCGKGTPTLILNGKVVSTGADYTVDGVINGIAYLQTGGCNFNGENCSLLEMNLANPQCPGCGSSTDISLIPPHAFNVPVSFAYSNGCDGQGTSCNSATCNTAFFQPNDNQVQVQCEADNVDLVITFCGDGAAAATSAATSAAAQPTTSKAASKPTSSSATSAAVHTTAAASSAVATSSAVESSVSSAPGTIVDVASSAASFAASSAAAAPTSAASASSASSSTKPSRCAKSKKRSTIEKKSPKAAHAHHRRHMH